MSYGTANCTPAAAGPRTKLSEGSIEFLRGRVKRRQGFWPNLHRLFNLLKWRRKIKVIRELSKDFLGKVLGRRPREEHGDT